MVFVFCVLWSILCPEGWEGMQQSKYQDIHFGAGFLRQVSAAWIQKMFYFFFFFTIPSQPLFERVLPIHG